MKRFLIFFILGCLFNIRSGLCQSLLPEKLPKEFNNPETKSVLKKWVNTPWDVNFNKRIRETEIDNETWMTVYFELRIFLLEKLIDEKTIHDLIKSVEETMHAYNEVGANIRVVFTPYIEVIKYSAGFSFDNQKDSELIHSEIFKKWGTKQEFVTYKTLNVKILSPFDPFWSSNSNPRVQFFKDSEAGCRLNGEGRPFADMDNRMIYLSQTQLDVLSHELNHLLFGNADAYFEERVFKYNGLLTEEDCWRLSCLNAADSDNKITELEIYAGLRRSYATAPGWDDYVEKTY